jgi:hypothetical protein
MNKLKKLNDRADLPNDIKVTLNDLCYKLGLPQLRDRLSLILTAQEKRAAGWEKLDHKTHPIGVANAVLLAVVQHRGISAERALIDLAHDLDLLNSGRYKGLRRAIGEPMDDRIDDVPIWNRAAGELSLAGVVIRKVSPQAKNVQLILDAFEEDRWAPHIDSPIPGGANSRRLGEAVCSANKGLSAIRLFCDGRGAGIQWRRI